jgi:hypothetical protein
MATAPNMKLLPSWREVAVFPAISRKLKILLFMTTTLKEALMGTVIVID